MFRGKKQQLCVYFESLYPHGEGIIFVLLAVSRGEYGVSESPVDERQRVSIRMEIRAGRHA